MAASILSSNALIRLSRRVFQLGVDAVEHRDYTWRRELRYALEARHGSMDAEPMFVPVVRTARSRSIPACPRESRDGLGRGRTRSRQGKQGSGTARKTNRGSLPAHLERVEQIVDVEAKACVCCGGALHQIGEDLAERLDVVPTTLRVLVARRPRCPLPCGRSARSRSAR
jgi:hypothetical protein